MAKSSQRPSSAIFEAIAAMVRVAPTGKSGTSVESFILRIENGLVVQWDVADHSLDLANYLHDQGTKMPTFVTPPVEINRRIVTADVR